MSDSVFDVAEDSSDYAPVTKPAKAKPVQKKAIISGQTKTATAAKKPTQKTLKPKDLSKKRVKPESDDENSERISVSPDDDASLLSNTPPSAKRQKKLPGPKKSSGKPLQPINNESYGFDGTTDQPPAAKAKKTEQYQKLTQLEHILKRPDTYIGSIERTEKQMWVFNSETESMECREVSFVPGLYKIFDEILVNAADNKQRDKNMNEIRVEVDREKGMISIRNNGRGIPIEIHSKEGIYIPEMIFGHLLTSSNYDDEEQKVTGGRNGFGAKLCNIYSNEFILETADERSKQKYRQVWKSNMSQMDKAKISANKGEDYTKITFYPDFNRFGMNHMDNDFEAIVKRRVYDLAGTCKDVNVFLNGDRIKLKTFKKYMEMYTKAIKAEDSGAAADDATAKESQVILTERVNDRWEVGFAVSDGSFQQVSFVNSIATTSGGTHVNYVSDQIVSKLLEIVKKKNKGGVQLKPAQVRNHIFLFINCLIVNPAFTSQTKEQLTTKSSQFGSKCTVSEKFLKDIAKSSAVDNILHFADKKADQVLKKSDGNRRTRMNNSKLTDANKAGTRDGYQCTLILTEGDSASLLALAGRAVVDPDRIGVFPLRGKLLNVRDASVDQVSKNQEIQNIKKFMGLQHKKVYDDTKSLRYGSIMIMTDQDHDGSHIKGLLINFLEVSYPSLLKLPGFLKEFITPIVKVWKGDVKEPKKLQSFFTMPQYEEWKLMPGNNRGWDHKYFKGLGTSSPADAEIYFRDLDRHLKEFHTMQTHEPEYIELAFSKKKADARKEWLRQFKPGTYLDMTTAQITYDDFINKELILFSMADNMRSIPSVIDGLKPGQRKVLYTCFRRNLKKDVKVVELAGSVSGLTAYAYGETSLQQTIVGLAQNFVGSNNLNCLEPSGNFGSRLQGGNDCASARYIYTRLSPFARKIFHTTDEPLLKYNQDDGKDIEPEVYCPVLPMILINGADGIGTGWSSSIPNYNPEDVVGNIKLRMSGSSKEDMKPMTPWFRGWKGQLEDLGEGRFKSSGQVADRGNNEIEITELPVRVWTQDFKDKLEEIIKAEKTPSFIKDYTEYNTPVNVHFIIKMEDKQMQIAVQRGLEEQFKLSKTMATTNLVAFDRHGRINKYASVLDILEEFYHVRLGKYDERKRHMLGEMEKDIDKMTNQARFIEMIIDGKLVVSRKAKKVLVEELRVKGFRAIPKLVDARKQGEFEAIVEEDAEVDESNEDAATVAANVYDYLLGMPIWSLTQERFEKLKRNIGDREAEHKTLTKTSTKEIWTRDLDDFLEEWRFQLADEQKRSKKLATMGRRTSTKMRIAGKSGPKKRKQDLSDDDSDFEASKPKRSAAAAKKPSDTFDRLAKKDQSFARDTKPALKAPLMSMDGSAEREPEVLASQGASSTLKRSFMRPKSSDKIGAADNYEASDEDMFAQIAKEAPRALARGTIEDTARRGRAEKPTTYTISSEDEINVNDEDGVNAEVDEMVKVASRNASKEPKPAKATLSVSESNPSSNGGKTKSDKITSRHASAPLKQTVTGANKPAVAAKLSNIATKPPSPAAKAYAAKLAKARDEASDSKQKPIKPLTKVLKVVEKQKSATASDKDEGEDLEAIANDLLGDDDDNHEQGLSRPSRRAATNKARSKYVIDDDSDEDDDSADDSGLSYAADSSD
ncbi:MAG: DNA topoisomerase 2 [Chrysothrix sp. TS-e1954]|nr:MAG: DNA topoisomerase 2 [Chrysothrix sp. TS-e1954]